MFERAAPPNCCIGGGQTVAWGWLEEKLHMVVGDTEEEPVRWDVRYTGKLASGTAVRSARPDWD